MKTIIFVLIVSLLLVGAYINRIDVVHKTAPFIAEQYGVSIDELSVEQLDLDRIIVSEVSFSKQDDNSRLNADLKNVQITINVSMQAGVQITDVTTDEVKVIFEAKQEDQESSVTAVKEYINLLPVYAADIKNLGIEYYLNEQLLSKFQGHVRFKQDLLISGMLSYENINVIVDVAIEERKANVSLLDSVNEEEILKLNASYQIDNDWLLFKSNGTYTPRKFLPYFEQENFSFESVDGDFSVNAEFDLTRSLESLLSDFVAEFSLDAHFEWVAKQYDVQNAMMEIRVKCLMKGLSIDNCEFKQPQSIEVVFNKTPMFISEYLGRDFKKYYFDVNPNDVIRLRRTVDEKYMIDGDASLFVRPDSSDLKAKLDLMDVDAQLDNKGWSVLAKYGLNLDVRQISYLADMQRALLKMDGSIQSNHRSTEVYINDGASLSLFDVEYDDFYLARMEIKQEGEATSKYDADTQTIRMSKQKLNLSPKDAMYLDNQLLFSAVSHDLDRFVYSGRGVDMVSNFSVGELQVKKQSFTIQVADMGANIEFVTDDINAKGGLLLGSKRAPLNFLLFNNLSGGEGNISFESEPISLFENEVIAQVIGVTGFPLQLKDGSFTLDGDMSWDGGYQSVDMSVYLSAKHVDGDYAQNPFDNLNVDMRLSGGQGWMLVEPTQLTIDSLNVGIPLSDIRLQIDKYEYGVQQQPAVKVTDFYASALEGSVYSDELDIDLNKQTNKFSIYLSSLSLEKLIELNQTQDLIATGIINGELPMRLNEGVLEIDSGWMKANEEGGVIQYGRVKEVLQGNKDLALVAELLEDFQYSEMSAMVNLNADGALRLETKLHGRSPGAKFDAPVNMNFNIDLNLWKFLESARLLTRIGQDITQQVTAPSAK